MSDATRQFITFTIGAEEYGVDVIVIREIKGWTEVTRLPEAPAHVRGVINLRGAIVPIFDLRARFSGTLTEPSARHVVVVLSVHGRLIGVLVDAVADILTVQDSAIQPVPDIENLAAAFVEGLVPRDDRMVALLDLEQLFDIHSLAAASAAAPAAAQAAAVH